MGLEPEYRSDAPECEICGEPMKKARENADFDWLCKNNGCEGVR